MRTTGRWMVGALLLGVAWQARAEELSCTVKTVSSGYIFQIDNNGATELAALDGVTCPWKASEVGGRAKAFTSEHVLGKTIHVTVLDRKDRIAQVKARLDSGEDLAELLLAEGLASWNGRWSPDAERYQRVQEQAKAKGLGLWGPRGENTAAPAAQVSQAATPAPQLPELASGPSSAFADDTSKLSSAPQGLVLKGTRVKDDSIALDSTAVLAERERKKKAREQELLARERQISDRSKAGRGAGGVAGGNLRGGR